MHSTEYEIEKIMDAANITTMRDRLKLDEIIGLMHDENPSIRYWGATGCLILGIDAVLTINELI